MLMLFTRILMLFTRGFVGFSRQEFVDSAKKTFEFAFIGPTILHQVFEFIFLKKNTCVGESIYP